MPLAAPLQRPDDRLKLLARDRAGTQQGDPAAQHRHHRTFNPNRARSAVDRVSDSEARLLHRVGEGGWAGTTRTVGGWGDDGASESRDNSARPDMARHPNCNAVQSRTSQIANPGSIADRRDDGQRPGPEGLRQGAGVVVKDGDGLGLYSVCDVGDQWIEARTAFGFKDGRDCNGVAGVAGQTINGLGWQNDETASGESLGSLCVGRTQPRRA